MFFIKAYNIPATAHDASIHCATLAYMLMRTQAKRKGDKRS